MNKLTIFKKSVAAGALIGIGAVVKLSCDNQVIGSVLFSVGLFFICSFGMYLFTGRIAYISRENWKEYPIIWIGNLIGSAVSMILVRTAKPEIHESARSVMLSKLGNNIFSVCVLAFFCGIIMYLAVDNYKTSDSGVSKVFGVVIGVTVFMLCGFEHSIADMAYAALAVQTAEEVLKSFVFIIIVSVFNAIGSLSIKALLSSRGKK